VNILDEIKADLQYYGIATYLMILMNPTESLSINNSGTPPKMLSDAFPFSLFVLDC